MKTITTLPPFAAQEPERPRIVLRTAPTAEHPPIVKLGAAVVYREHGTHRPRRIRVVPPHEADPGRGHISSAAPVAAALIGLSEGQTGSWHDRDGKRRSLRVLRIEADLEPVGYINV